jgi:glutamate-1-semialdehyde 2,1-aminomutase
MADLFESAKQVIPSGVNSPVRAFKAVGGDPVFTARGKGPFLWDESGKRYVDFCGSWGALLFGHAPDGMVRAAAKAMKKGASFGTATAKEVELALAIRDFFPSVEKVRLVSSGTEAVMSAVRLARGFTGRKKILKIDGGYHGHADSLLVKAGSGAATFGLPDSAGVPEELARLTLSVPFNDVAALEAVFKKEGAEIAAFILEPVPANMGVVIPVPGYLEKARELTDRSGSILIFDEVITGFRIAPGGAQEYFGVRPDLTCLGKILGGGLPIAAFGGRAGIMDELAPEGPVYQAGTLSGNPVAVSAALWTLREIRRATAGPRNREELRHQLLASFLGKLAHELRKKDCPVQLNHVRSMFTLFFSGEPVTDYVSAKKSDTKQYAKFFHACLRQGVYLAPSQFEANFISFAHTKKILDQSLKIFLKSL